MRDPRHGIYGRLSLRDLTTDPVRITCPFCPHRHGRYSRSRLVARHGEAIQLDDLLDALVVCKWHRPGWMRRPGKYDPKCGAGFLPDPRRIP